MSTTKIVLREELGRLLSLNLSHSVCEQVGKCSCSQVVLRMTQRNPRTGALSVKPVPRRVPKSITLLAHGESEELPIQVLECTEVRSALRARPRRLSYRRVQ